MWYLTLSTIVLILYLLEIIFTFPLLLMLIISQSSFDHIKNTAFVAFLVGLIADIGNGRFLGQTTLFFLLISFLIQIYRKRFSEESLGFLFAFSFISINVYLKLFTASKILFLTESLIGSVLIIVFTAFLYPIWKKIS